MMTPKDVGRASGMSGGLRRRVEGLKTGFRIAYHTPLSIAGDLEEAWRPIEKPAKSLYLWWPKQLKVYGYEATRGFDWRYLPVEEDPAQRVEEHLGEVPEEVARGITVYGTPNDRIEKIEEYLEAWVTEFAFSMEFQDKSFGK